MPFRQFMCFSHSHIISKWHPGSVNIHGCISCQTGVRVSILMLCRFIYRDTVQVQK